MNSFIFFISLSLYMCLIKVIKDIQVKLEAIPSPSAIFYNAIIKRILGKSELQIAQEVVQEIDTGVLIDVGSGTGFLSIEIGKRAPELTIYGIDLSRKLIQMAQQNAQNAGFSDRLDFQLGDSGRLRFDDGSFDMAISTGMLHSLKDPIKVLNANGEMNYTPMIRFAKFLEYPI